MSVWKQIYVYEYKEYEINVSNVFLVRYRTVNFYVHVIIGANSLTFDIRYTNT